MRVALLNQRAGQGQLFSSLNGLCDDTGFDSIRILMAFARGAGVALVSEALSRFLARGGSAHAIVGLDFGGTSPEALEALHGMGVSTSVFGVSGDRTFHPKVWIFDHSGSGGYAAIVGSNNWTSGGIDSNCEVAIRVDGRRGTSVEDDGFADALDELWGTYRNPEPPLLSSHLRSVDSDLIRALAEAMENEASTPPDQRAPDIKDAFFGPVSAPREAIRRAPRRRIEQPTSLVQSNLPTTLYLEVLGPETGQGREIQLPLAVLTDYFGVTREDAYFLSFRHADGSAEPNRPLAVYDINSTFRISSEKFAEVSRDERPMIVRLERIAQDVFEVAIILNNTSGYADAETYLNRGGGVSKRWGTA
jgi:hypothetical protein